MRGDPSLSEGLLKNRRRHRVRLAVTLGDPRGIGPEIAAAAARILHEDDGAPDLLFVGPRGTGAERAADGFRPVGDWASPEGSGGAGPEGEPAGSAPRGAIGANGRAARAGRLAGAAIAEAAGLALAGEVAGVVTAPIDKAALNTGGYPFPGHTEMLAELAGARAVAMLMTAERTALGGPLRVALATTHLPLARVSEVLTAERIVAQGRLVGEALRQGWGLEQPALALCALNPHASDGGLFGDEEARVLTPARDALRADGWRVEGPIPADTVFLRAIRGEFDAVIAPYHDVGMAAFKTAAFGRGVNVTLGLPFVRTSPDHGTALDIAGRGVADPSSMVEALRLCARLAASPMRTQWAAG